MHMQSIQASIAMAEKTDREETDLPVRRHMTSNQYSPLFSADDYGYGDSLAE